MRYLLLTLLIFSTLNLFSQSKYFQQALDYNISVELDDKQRSLTGFETIVYKNNAPDALQFIWFHIYPNAYRDTTTALFQQLREDDSRSVKLKNVTYGRIEGLAFKINGVAASTEPHPNPRYIDVIKLHLLAPLKPGDSITITTPFKVFLPSYFSRSGFSGGEFMVTQWYPKPAVYDNTGWHQMPYLDMGEFYSEYGKYQVAVTVPSAYVVAATGTLQDTAELNRYKEIGAFNKGKVKKPAKYVYTGKETKKTLHYIADSVPDVAWFADMDFTIQYDTIRLRSGRVVDAFTYYHDARATPWIHSIEYVKDATKHYSQWIGEYDYPVVQAVEGPVNNASGGMEYPMVTLVTSPDAESARLDEVITHEVGHNWFMAFLGTNERQYPWMDEGLNSYYEYRYEAEKYRDNSVFGDKIPSSVKSLPVDQFQSAVYNALAQLPFNYPVNTPSTGYKNSQDYGLTAYAKTALWVYMLEASTSKDRVDAAFRNYFRQWKYKHPQPLDLKASFEQAFDGKLDDFFKLLDKTGSFK